jgi:hypothetical protein
MSSKFQEIINRWPSRRALAEDVGVNLYAVHHWHNRNRIPAEYDAALLVAAGRRGIALGFEELVMARAKRISSEVSS